MRSSSVLLALVCALVLLGSARAAGSGVTADPGVVTLGDTFTVTICGLTAGQGGYYEIENSTVAMVRSYGPVAASCVAFPESTASWAAARYRIIAYVWSKRGTTRLGATSVEVDP